MKTIEKLNARFADLQQIVSPLLDKKKIPSLVGEYNEKLVDYESLRHLDAWARILNIQDPCSAVAQIDNIIYVSFNKVEKVANLNALKHIENHLSNDAEGFLYTALLFNRGLADQSLYNTSLAQQLNNNLKLIRGKLLSTKIITQPDRTNFFELQEKLFASYDSKDQKLIEILLRINQDISKIIHYKNNTNIKFQLIENSKELHAELAILSWIKENGLLNNIDYIGISKLSCYLCTEILDELNITYRGSHGKLYLNKWVFPNELFSEDADKNFESLINKVEAHRSKYWQEAGNFIADNKKLSEKLPLEEAELSDGESDEDIVLVKPIQSAITICDIKEFVQIKQIHLLGAKAEAIRKYAQDYAINHGEDLLIDDSMLGDIQYKVNQYKTEKDFLMLNEEEKTSFWESCVQKISLLSCIWEHSSNPSSKFNTICTDHDAHLLERALIKLGYHHQGTQIETLGQIYNQFHNFDYDYQLDLLGSHDTA